MVVKINNKSDFKINEWSESIALEVPFEFIYYVPLNKEKYVASYDGHSYINCVRLDDGSLDVMFNNHGLGIGRLKVVRKYFIDDLSFADGVFDVISDDQTDVFLTSGKTFDTYVKTLVVPPYLKGDKGEPMRWETMTEVERGELVKDLAEAIDPEMVMTENEQERIKAERERVAAENGRANVFGELKTEMEQTIEDGKAATSDAQKVVDNYNTKVAEQDGKLTELGSKLNDVTVESPKDQEEEQIWVSDDGLDEYAKVSNKGVTAKGFFDKYGNEIKNSGLSTKEVGGNDNLELCDENGIPILVIDSKGNINTASFYSKEVAVNTMKDKTMLYIGDSISTMDTWKWKGSIERTIGLKAVSYNDNDKVNVTPAVGSITIRPNNDDDSRPMNAESSEVYSGAKSIWWRCAKKRLGIYDFDMICLFGGTNDVCNNNLNVGTIDDKPLLDTDVTDLSTLDLNNVSFASAFMGCIEMLKRDFPSKPIVICTLLYNIYAKTKDVVGLQMLAAKKYGCKFVPLYYSEYNSESLPYMSNDGIHPNELGATIVAKKFIEYVTIK